MIPAFPTAKLIGFGIALIAVLGFIYLAFSWKGERDSLREWRDSTVAATRTAVGDSKVKAADVPRQILELGNSLKSTTDALNRQNAAVDALAKRTEEQQREASQALSNARTRAREAEGASARLIASSRAERASTGVCEPSETVQELWK